MVLRALARPLLASWFVYAGVESILEPETRAKRSAPVVEPVLEEIGLTDVSTEDLVKAHGLATVAAATTLALSRSPRTSAVALAGLAAVTVAAGRPFWLETDEDKRKAELEQFLKNVALLGGVLVASTAGHSARHKARVKAKKVKAKEKAAEAKSAAKAAKKSPKKSEK